MPRPLRSRLPVLVGVLALALVAPLGPGGAARPGGAQETATPPAEAGSAGSSDVLLQATLDRRTGGPLALQLLRLTLQPGGQSSLHAHPGPEFGIVESGSLTIRVTGRAVLLPNSPSANGESSLVPVGLDVALAPGDRIAYAPGTQMTFRNPGTEPTTVLAATMLPAGIGAPPGVVWANGTPTEDEQAGVQSQLLGQAIAYSVPQGRVVITLERLDLRAGDRVPGYPGPVVVAVETGALAGAVLGGTVALPAAAATPAVGTPAAGATPETGFALNAGQFLYFPEGMAATPPLGGDGTVVLLRLGLLPVAPDFGNPTTTPVPAPTAVDAPPTAAPEGEALAEGTRVVVAVSAARLRAEPSLEGPVLDGLDEGRVLIVTGPAERDVAGLLWYPVRDAENPNLTGFVAADLVVPE